MLKQLAKIFDGKIPSTIVETQIAQLLIEEGELVSTGNHYCLATRIESIPTPVECTPRDIGNFDLVIVDINTLIKRIKGLIPKYFNAENECIFWPKNRRNILNYVENLFKNAGWELKIQSSNDYMLEVRIESLLKID